MDVRQIRAVAFDIDGVFTDGSVWLGPGGEEYKRACFLDIMGVSRARRAGVLVAFISGEDTPFVHQLAQRLGVVDVWAGCGDKASAFRELGERHGLNLREIGFMGDDVNDVEAMGLAGFAAAPSTAHRTALAVASLVTERAGGQGAVREAIDFLSDRNWSLGDTGEA
jgi:3-deoxy-D-manno-octulosonate 8-phosphate phosphatase (KDO 8-P phosphatase)